MSSEFEPNKDVNQKSEVDTKDTKTSKLETGLFLATVTTIAVLIVWGGLVAASVIDISIINNEKAAELVNTLNPVILTVVVTQLLLWLTGKNKIGS